MEKWNWTQCKSDYILFVEAGFIAVTQMDEDSALKLFKAASMLNPDHYLSKLGMGYLYLHKLDIKKATKYYQEVLDMDPHNDMAKTMLGIAMSLDPNMTAQAEKLLEQTHHSKDKSIQNLSDTTLHFINKFIKKAPSPVEGTRKHK